MASQTLDRLNVILEADDSRFKKVLEGAGERMQSVGKRMQGIGRTMSARVSVPIAAAGTAALGFAVNAGKAADKLLDLSQQTGLNTTSLQEWRVVAEAAGVAQDAVAKGIEGLTRRMARGEGGSADMQRAFEALGIATHDAEGNLRSMDDIANEAITALSAMEDVTQRNVLANQLFAGGASELIPVLGLGADAIDEYRQKAHETGRVLSTEALEANNEFRKGMDELKGSLGAAATELGTALIPVVNELVPLIQEHAVPLLRRFAEWIGNVDEGTLKWVAAAAGLVAALGPVVLIIGKVIAVVGALLNPIGLVIAAIVALGAAWVKWGDDIKPVLNGAVKVVKATAQAIAKIFNWLVDNSFGQMLEGIEKVSDGFKWLRDKVVGNSYMVDLADGVEEQVGRIVRSLLSMEDTTLSVPGLFDTMASKVEGILEDLISYVGQVLTALVNNVIGDIDLNVGFGVGGIGVGIGGPNPVMGPGAFPGPTFSTGHVSGGSMGLDMSSLPPYPKEMSPEAIAVDSWWRQAFGSLANDAKRRGVL